ncbi:MAG: Dabb family protein [Bacteroidales bacterium]|nr:Dabb family protein [Bacteroidales bacterium]
MVKHIVLIKLKETEPPSRKNLNALELKKQLESLNTHIDEIYSIEVGLNFTLRKTSYDIALTTEFETEKEMEVYRNHPVHLEVLEFLREVTELTAVVDYMIS